MPQRRVALIIDASKPYDRKIIGGVASYVRLHADWSLYIEEDPLQKLPDLREWQADGIVSNFDDPTVAKALTGVDTPVVGMGGGYGSYDPASRVPYFATDNDKIAQLAAEHLIGHGFRRFAYCGLRRNSINRWSEERADAFKRRLRESGYSCSVLTGRHSSARKWRQVQQELSAWLRSLRLPVGLMACNDARARHVLEVCREMGLRVPDDVAVIGVDNDEMMCELTSPPLSSVEQGVRRMGFQAAALLDRLMAGARASPLRYVIQPEGVVSRQSTDTLVIEDADLAAALQFIRRHACDGICLADVLEAAPVCCSTLAKRFRTVLGRTIHAEIQRVQMERAGQLLAQTNLPIKTVARRVAFKSSQYFSTVFRRTTGCTPAEYRRDRRP